MPELDRAGGPPGDAPSRRAGRRRPRSAYQSAMKPSASARSACSTIRSALEAPPVSPMRMAGRYRRTRSCGAVLRPAGGRRVGRPAASGSRSPRAPPRRAPSRPAPPAVAQQVDQPRALGQSSSCSGTRHASGRGCAARPWPVVQLTSGRAPPDGAARAPRTCPSRARAPPGSGGPAAS